jgi:hypothetical protein
MSQALKIILIVLASLIGLLVLFILIRFLLLQEHGNGSKLYRKYASNSDRMDACYRKILYQAASLNVNQLPSDTITSFAQRVDTRLGSHAMTVVCAPIIRMRFGQEKPIDEDVHRLCAFSEALEKRLRRELGLCRYIWARVIKLRRLP